MSYVRAKARTPRRGARSLHKLRQKLTDTQNTILRYRISVIAGYCISPVSLCNQSEAKRGKARQSKAKQTLNPLCRKSKKRDLSTGILHIRNAQVSILLFGETDIYPNDIRDDSKNRLFKKKMVTHPIGTLQATPLCITYALTEQASSA